MLFENCLLAPEIMFGIYYLQNWVFGVVCICCCLYFLFFAFVVLFVLICLFEKYLWKPGDPEENHFDPGGEKGVESNILEGTNHEILLKL